MRYFLALVFLSAALIGGLLGVFSVSRFSINNPAETPSAPKRQEATLLFVGDIMLSRSIGKLMAERRDYLFPFASTTEFIRSADIAFANLENPVSERGVKSGSTYSFRAKPETLAGLRSAGFDVVSVANNHIWDYGREAFLDTLANLRENGIVPVGGGADYAGAHTPQVLTAGGTRIAFLAYTNLLPASLGKTDSSPALSLLDMWRFSSYDEKRHRSTIPALAEDIRAAKVAADIVVVSFHWGDEYQTRHTGEQERVAHLAIDAGAELIVGHHPHVVQEVEEYNGGWIFYSLGNFIFDQNFSRDTRRGLAVEVMLKDGKISDVITREVAFTSDFQPHFVEEKISQ